MSNKRSALFSGILTAIFYVDQKVISIEYMYGNVKPMNSSIVVESDMQPRVVFTFLSSSIRVSIQMVISANKIRQFKAFA